MAGVTVRAELCRLRPLLGPAALDSRPYRLAEPLSSDAGAVHEALARGEVGGAVDLYRGPVLPSSDAPGVVRLRRRLHDELREALFASRDPDALLRFADTDHGRLDWQVWHAAAALLPATSSRGDQVRAHLAYLDAELAGSGGPGGPGGRATFAQRRFA
jgi:hypothetical protein